MFAVLKVLLALAMSIAGLAGRQTEPGFGRYSPANATPEQVVRAVFGEEADNAMKVMDCESKGDPKAEGRYKERGLFQIHPVHTRRGGGDQSRLEKLGYTWDQMFEIIPNIRVAHDLWKEQGWRPWTCRPRR